MAELDYKSRSLSGLFVYYERLKSEFDGKNRSLYDNVNSSLNSIRSEYRENTRISLKLQTMSKNELAKELSLLKNVFSAPLDINFNKPGEAKKLIDTLNNYMNLKEVYKRSLSLLSKDKTHLSVAQYFPSYFQTVWNNEIDNVIKQIADAVGKKRKTETIIRIADEILSKELERMVKEAINNMLNSNEVANKEDEKAYSALIDGIDRAYGRESFSAQLYNLYHLDELKQSLLATIENNSKKIWRSSLQKINAKEIVAKNYYRDGGVSLEYLENLTINEIIKGLKDLKNVRFTTGGAIHTGATGMKADNIIVFGIDPSIIEKVIENSEKGTREKNYQLVKALGEKISNIDDSFIVYSNAKNYSLSENFRGFSGGASISLEKYRSLMSKIEQKNPDTFIGGIMQTLRGAIGDDMRFDFQNWIAEDIAYFLFDDFDTIGLPQGSGTSIHIFNLDGILVPLSFFLWLMAEAVEKGTRNPHNIIKAQIDSGEIEWKEEQSAYTKEMWIDQRERALKQVSIGVTFLQDFKDIMKEFLL